MAFVDNIITGFRGYNPISYTAHLWTISLEEQFYLVLPLLLAGLLAVPTRLLRGLFACWLLFLAIRIIAVLLKAPHPMIWTSASVRIHFYLEPHWVRCDRVHLRRSSCGSRSLSSAYLHFFQGYFCPQSTRSEFIRSSFIR